MSDQQTEYNAAEVEQVKSRKEKIKTRDLQKKSALRGLMSNADGRMWMWDLLTLCGVYHSSFSNEALVMAFNEGRRDTGNRLIAEINRLDGGSELFRLMAVENQREG